MKSLAGRALPLAFLGVLGCTSVPEEDASSQVGGGDAVVIQMRTPPAAAVASPSLDHSVGVPTGGTAIEKAVDVKATPNGGFVVADAMARNLKVFGAGGDLMRVVGRQGSGPGEFAGLTTILREGDALWVPDALQLRISQFDMSTWAYRGAVRWDPEDGIPVTWAVGEPHRLVQGVIRLPSSNAGGVVVRSRVDEEFVELFETSRAENLDPRAAVFGDPPLLAVRGDGTVLVGYGDSGVLHVYESSGRLVAVMRWTESGPVTIPQGDREYLQRLVSGQLEARWGSRRERMAQQASSSQMAAMDRLFATRSAQTPVPTQYPQFTGLLVDDSGRLWIRRPVRVAQVRSGPYALDWADMKLMASSWEVYRPDGSGVMRVVLPFGFVLTDVHANWLYGFSVDELGQRIVQRLRMERAESE